MCTFKQSSGKSKPTPPVPARERKTTRSKKSRGDGQGPGAGRGGVREARATAHNPPSQPKETSTGRDAPQEEAIRKFAMQLRHIGDSIQHRMVQEDLQQEGREALAHVVLLVYRRVQVMFRFFWNNHLL